MSWRGIRSPGRWANSARGGRPGGETTGTRRRPLRLSAAFWIATLALPAGLAWPQSAVKFPTVGRGQVVLSGTLMVPEGQGPFPAVILLHGVNGIDPTLSGYHGRWAREGFSSLVVDSYGPRGVIDQVGHHDPEIARGRILDAYGAIRYLQSLPQVDGSRIAVIGFSDGGRVALATAGGAGPGRPLPRAAVGYYPNCWIRIQTLRIPFLAHVAALDDWGGPQHCPALFERLTQVGAPLELHRYAGTHHAFDHPNRLRPFRVPGGGTVQYDPAAEQAAWERTVAFLRKHLGLQKP